MRGQRARAEGLREAEFIARIAEELGQPQTCVLGYNSIRFDDEFVRFGLYRNFHDPYEREWRNGNSRWDLLDVLRLAEALRPEGLVWPRREDGAPSFKLEHLAEANGVREGEAHEALSDVRALIGLARKFKAAQPRLWDYAYALRDKRKVSALLDVANMTPLLHISSRYPASRHCAALVAPIATILASFVRFYTSPMVFAYDPFVGYFSGTLYDTVVDASGLVTYRAGSAATLLAAFMLALHLGRNDQGRVNVQSIGRPGLALVGGLAAVVSFLHVTAGPRLGHWHTRGSISEPSVTCMAAIHTSAPRTRSSWVERSRCCTLRVAASTAWAWSTTTWDPAAPRSSTNPLWVVPPSARQVSLVRAARRHPLAAAPVRAAWTQCWRSTNFR